MSQPWIDIALTWAAPAAAWMLTYLLHSTVLLGLAAAATLVLRERRPALQEVVWKCALVGGIATATLQLGAGWTPLAGAWELPGVAAVEAAADEPLQREEGTGTAAAIASPATDRAGALDVDREPLAATAGERLAAADAPPAAETASIPLLESAAAPATGDALGTASEAAATSPAPAFSAWPLLAVAAWLAFAAVFATRLGADYLRLAVRLRERWPVADGAVAALFGRLLGRSGRRRPVSLSGSERLPVPIAWGLARPEVSLPARVLSDLSPYHQESILAHELAHVLRGDPAWLAAARAIEAVLFFQPLNRVARRRLAELAEVHCDDRAVELTGKPLELARCLTEVAAWRLTGVAALPVPSMASGSSLGRRVRRLVDGERGERLPRWVRPAAAVAVLAVALAAPGITRGKPAPQEPTDEPVATEPIGEPAAAAAAEPDNAGWVIVDDGDVRAWEDLTPEERERVRRQVAEARVHAQRAGVEAREALRAALDGLRQRRETLGADGGREALEAARLAHRQALDAVRHQLDASHGQALAASRRAAEEARLAARQGRDERLDEVRRERREMRERMRRDLERRLEDARREAEDHSALDPGAAAAVQAEALAAAAVALEEVERMLADGSLERQIELSLAGLEGSLPALVGSSVRLGLGAATAALAGLDLSEMAEVEEEVAAAMAEMERELAELGPEHEAEIAAALAELEAEMPALQAEIEAAMAEVERELAAEGPEIEAELAAALAELETEMPLIEAELAAAMAELEAEMPEIEAEIEAALAEVERELAAIAAELADEEEEAAEEEAEREAIESEEIDPEIP